MDYAVYLQSHVRIAGPFLTRHQAEAYVERLHALYQASNLLPLHLTVRSLEERRAPSQNTEPRSSL